MVDCVPILARGQAHPLSHRHEPPTPLPGSAFPCPLALPRPRPFRALPYPPVRFGYGDKAGSPGHPARGSSLLRELGVEYSLEDRGMFRHLPPLLVPDITFSDPSKEPCGRSDFVVADSQGQAARQGASGVAALHAEQRKQAKYRPACAATPATASSPSPSRPSEGSGLRAELHQDPSATPIGAPLPHRQRRLRCGAGRALLHTAPRGKFAASAGPPARRKAVWESQDRDMSLQARV